MINWTKLTWCIQKKVTQSSLNSNQKRLQCLLECGRILPLTIWSLKKRSVSHCVKLKLLSFTKMILCRMGYLTFSACVVKQAKLFQCVKKRSLHRCACMNLKPISNILSLNLYPPQKTSKMKINSQ